MRWPMFFGTIIGSGCRSVAPQSTGDSLLALALGLARRLDSTFLSLCLYCIPKNYPIGLESQSMGDVSRAKTRQPIDH
jgi:hypothetical protein